MPTRYINATMKSTKKSRKGCSFNYILFLMSTYLALISESSLQFERLMGTTSKHGS